MNEHSETPLMGTYTYQSVFEAIQLMIGYDKENVKLRINKTSASVTMYGSLAFNIVINSKSQYLRITADVDPDYLDKIQGLSIKNGVTKLPLSCFDGRDNAISDLINEIYASKLASIDGEMIGCCDMFVMCSDALHCLRSSDPHYNGCLYRKNLESGRIFYGKNKNI